jgi:hypothetical protein
MGGGWDTAYSLKAWLFRLFLIGRQSLVVELHTDSAGVVNEV